MCRFLKKPFNFVLVALCACTPVTDRPAVVDDTSLAKREMWSWSTLVTDRGQVRAQVLAGYLVQAPGSQRAQFSKGVRVVFFNGAGDTISTLTADRGEIGASGDNMKVFGSVVVIASDSTQLQTDSLRWDRDQDRIMGDGLVEIVRPNGTETGVGFDASSDLKQWTLNFVTTRMKRTDP